MHAGASAKTLEDAADIVAYLKLLD